VFYDGLGVLANLDGASLVQPLRGIYQSAADPAALLTIIGASGQPNTTDRIRFSNAATGPAGFTPAITDAFRGTSLASDRSWNNRLIPLSSLLPGFLPPSTANPNYGFGETLVATVDHTSTTPYDCVSLDAIVMSTAIKDVDRDGAPDGIEDGVATSRHDLDAGHEGRGRTALPNLSAMNGSSHHKDIYFQMDAMRTTATTTDVRECERPVSWRGSRDCQWSGDARTPYHMPTPAAAKIIIDTYRSAPITNDFTVNGTTYGDGTQGLWPHLDVGDPHPT
jgi:hypothetical protein